MDAPDKAAGAMPEQNLQNLRGLFMIPLALEIKVLL
jgi:hypothetical protein